MKKNLLIFILFFILLPAFGEGRPDRDITRITYKFIDSSVPPEYHRSYAVTITRETISVTVDSYGEILAEEHYPSGPEEFNETAEALKVCKIKTGRNRSDRGCAGGTGERITVEGPDGIILSGTVYHCGGKDSGDLYGDVSGFAATVKKFIPDLPSLLK